MSKSHSVSVSLRRWEIWELQKIFASLFRFPSLSSPLVLGDYASRIPFYFPLHSSLLESIFTRRASIL